MDLQSKIQELAARFALDLVTAFRSATLEDIRSISGFEAQPEQNVEAAPKPKRPRRKRSWRRIKRYRRGK